MNKKMALGVLFVTILGMVHGEGEQAGSIVKKGDEVFAKWLVWQRVVEDVAPKNVIKTDIVKNNGKCFKDYCKKKHDMLASYAPCLNSLSEGFFSGQQDEFNIKTNKTLMHVYDGFDHNIGELLNTFEQHGFIQPFINKEEQTFSVETMVRRCRGMLKTFFPFTDHKVRYQYCFGIANRMFDWCYGEKTHQVFSNILSSPDKHQLARLCYGSMWYYLVGEGWKHWHKSCLKQVAKEAQKGKEIVYVGGGSDIYQLLKYGVYNIRVIDPLLPSQPEYYSEGWNWFVEGIIGDKLDVDLGDKKRVFLIRETHDQKGTFKAQLSTGQTVDLPLSVTQWSVYNDKEKKRLGTIVFDRRFCKQDDFVYNKKQAHVISFNEMYFVAVPTRLYGWGIDVSKFDSKFTFYVKQLYKPVKKDVLINIRNNEEAPFSFILLGSCAT